MYKDYLLKDNQKWKLGKIIKQIKRKDGVVRGYKIKTGNGYIIERPIQLVADLEIGKETSENVTELNDRHHRSNQGQETREVLSQMLRSYSWNDFKRER